MDSYGTVTERNDVCVDTDIIRGVLSGFVGEFEQMPPLYSAKSVDGVRAYKLARNGVEVSLSPKKITVYEIELISKSSDDTYVFDIKCGGGTYIRSLARDIAKACGTVGYMSGLIRIQSGAFCLEDAYTLDEVRELKEKCLLDIRYPLKDVESYVFDDKYFDDIDFGRKIKCPFEIGYRRIYCRDVFFGLGRNVDGILKIDYYLKNA